MPGNAGELKAKYIFYINAMQALQTQLNTFSEQAAAVGEEETRIRAINARDSLGSSVASFQDAVAILGDVT